MLAKMYLKGNTCETRQNDDVEQEVVFLNWTRPRSNRNRCHLEDILTHQTKIVYTEHQEFHL